MNLKLLIGIVLFVIGLATAVVGIAGVGQPDTRDSAAVIVEENQSLHLGDSTGWLTLPFIAGLSLAVGGLLIGLSLGSFKNPRTSLEPGDQVVNPEGYHKMKHV